MTTVVLFDIDGTILWTDGAGRRAVHRALQEVFGAPPPEGHEFDGKTDPQIVRELMQLAGVSDGHIETGLPHAIARYVELLSAELGAVDHGDKVFPGVAALLDVLEARDDVLLGLLTGNVREGAEAKLTAVGIAPHRFRVGAFGSDHAERPELPAIARGRAEVLMGKQVPGHKVVVIGDTPADMGCGRGIGARAIGVATGRYTMDDLRACDAAAVFPDLSDTAAVMRAIMDA
ncbi:MAG TPA: HAD hydrolase-like protein [Gemmatimonadaceae bacterium]|nr:HAD hydrolase-like protein [Gemmatimonadaceae bacterium]